MGTMLTSSRYVSGTAGRMAEKTLADRVAALEAKVGSKTIDEQFREQAELIDRLFTYRFEEFDKTWDAKLGMKLAKLERSLEARLEQTLETKFDAKLKPIQADLATVKTDLAAVKDAVTIIVHKLS